MGSAKSFIFLYVKPQLAYFLSSTDDGLVVRLKFAIYIYDRPAGNYLLPRGSLSHQDYCKLFCLAFSAENQRKSSDFVLLKLNAHTGMLFFYQSRGACNNLTVNGKAKFSFNNNFVIE